MIDFLPLDPARREEYTPYIRAAAYRGCACDFPNLFMWGRQQAAIAGDMLLVHSRFDDAELYHFPMGPGELGPAVEAVIADAKERGIRCRFSGLSAEDAQRMEDLFPGRFEFRCYRDGFDYVYAVDDLADLKGRKYQPKRNHCNRFEDACPGHRIGELDEQSLPQVREFAERWYELRRKDDPEEDLEMEHTALRRCLSHYRELGMFGLGIWDGEEMVAFTIASFLSEDTLDVHFEKAAGTPGAYAAINRAFARYVRDKLPQIRYLNREDDAGSPGLRQAKLSYQPHHMVEKYTAVLHA